MILKAFTFAHVVISLVGIGSGLVVVLGMLRAKRLDGWTALFLATTVATTVTGFFFPFKGITPAIATGVVSMIVLALAIAARYRYLLAGAWRPIYVASAVTALYLNVFVLIVQSFMKVPALNALAPTQTEMPFKATQLAALIFFTLLGAVAAKKFKVPETAS